MKTFKEVSNLKTMLIVSVILFAFGACVQTEETGSIDSQKVFAQEVMEEAPMLFTDPQIAAIVVVANQIDVDYGKHALEKSKNEEVLRFAKTMITDHKQIIQSASELVGRLGVVPEESDFTQILLKGQEDVMRSFEGLVGPEFDKAYIDNEVTYHDAVINAVTDILIPQAKNEELKQTLIDVSPLLIHHLEMAKMAQAKFK